MQPSLLRRVLFAYLGFGAVVASIFPVYANFFVDWKPGMLTWFVLGCFVAGLMIGLANYWMLNIILISKLKKISHIAGMIASRDLSRSCDVVSRDTIGEIVTSFNNMASTLREMIGQTSGLSSQVRNGSNVIRTQASAIFDRVGESARLTRDIATSIQQLESAITDISTRGEQAANRSAEAANTARDGVAKATDSITGMEQIHARISSATDRVEKLAQSSQEVGKIVAVIKEIADQTNLLALNAAIEAARAGEQGRGFAVVADEVRKLAEKTSDATMQIDQMINTIQQETGMAIQAISDSMDEAQSGVGHARQTGASLSSIIEAFSHVDVLVREIASSTAVQKTVSAEVFRHVQAIEALNGETLNDSKEGMNLSSRLVEDINQLDQMVKTFKL